VPEEKKVPSGFLFDRVEPPTGYGARDKPGISPLFDETERKGILDLANRLCEEATKNSSSETSRKLWKELVSVVKNATLEGFAHWSELEKAKLFLAFASLQPFGFRMAFLPDDLGAMPTEGVARDLWKRAMRSLGHSV